MAPAWSVLPFARMDSTSADAEVCRGAYHVILVLQHVLQVNMLDNVVVLQVEPVISVQKCVKAGNIPAIVAELKMEHVLCAKTCVQVVNM